LKEKGNFLKETALPRCLQEPSANFTKNGQDAFSNERLSVHLTKCGVKELFIGGVYAEACVTATTRTALRRGFDVTVLTDAVGSTTEHARERACTRLARLGAKLATVESAMIQVTSLK
jgi:nicotinamidase-related amidase